jgi:uncharacterized iron-regulated membrane protein
MVRLHFGRAYGPVVRTLWVIFGLMPAALFITGALMWWSRTLRPYLQGRFARMRSLRSATD